MSVSLQVSMVKWSLYESQLLAPPEAPKLWGREKTLTMLTSLRPSLQRSLSRCSRKPVRSPASMVKHKHPCSQTGVHPCLSAPSLTRDRSLVNMSYLVCPWDLAFLGMQTYKSEELGIAADYWAARINHRFTNQTKCHHLGRPEERHSSNYRYYLSPSGHLQRPE